MVLGIGVSWGILTSAVGKILFQWDQVTSEIEINRQDRTLDITAIGFRNDEVFHYSLDGWTGRYSMPLEFLLSTHIATMAPDLSYKLATTFNTDVEILLWKSKSNSLTGGISQDGGETVPYNKFVISELNAKKRAAIIFRQCPSLHSLIRGENDGDSDYWCTNDSCSDKLREDEEMKETCQGCADFIDLLTRAAHSVGNSGEKFDTFVPYINSVTDHWFRNVYFTYGGMKQYAKDNGVEIPDVVVRDEEYYLSTGEMWTEYEMTADGSDYELYVYLPTQTGDYTGKFALDGTLVCMPDDNGPYSVSEKAGNMYDKKGNGGYGLYVVSGSGKNKKYVGYGGDVEEFRVGKKAKTEKKEEGWNVYSLAKDKTGEGEWEIYTDDGDNYIKEAKKLKGVEILYNLVTLNGSITQKEDGVRGETNVKTKKLFLDDYYLYDGSGPRAAAIEMAKNAVKLYTPDADYNDPDSFRALAKLGHFTEGRMQNIRYKGKSYEATIDDISGPINILQNSLTAFSILRNMHTLDAEYIYHDFKELIVELDYFDKEDLIESEREVMMFPISGLSSAGWPVTRYDKSEEFYGTLIHSAKDYETLKQRTVEEIAEKFGPDEDTGEFADSEEDQTEQSEVTSGQGSIVASQDDSCTHLVTINGVTYKQFAQGKYSNIVLPRTDGGNGQVSECGCGFCSATSILTGYGHDIDLNDTLQKLKELGMNWNNSGRTSKISQLLGAYGVSGEWNNSGGWKKTITEAFDEGKPVIVRLAPGSTNIWNTNGGHYLALLGVDSNGNLYTADSATSLTASRRLVNSGGVDGFVNSGVNIAGVWVPSQVPSGSAGMVGSITMANFDGYEGGEAVLAPVTGEVIKYGTVKRKNLETEQDEEVGFIKIRVLGNQEALPGSTCNYFGKDDKKKGYNYFWEEYTEASITNHVLYIEGFDVSQVLGGNGDTNCGVKGPNIAKLKEYIEQNDDDGGECNYTTKYLPPALPNGINDPVKEAAIDEAQKKEDAKKDAAYTATVDTKIYIKEGAVIGHTYTEDQADMEDGVGNYMRLIFRDADDQVVENVEHYMEIEDATFYNENADGESSFIIGDDYDTRVSAGECLVTKEQFKQIFAAWPKMVDYADDFYIMQNKYGVSAVFAGAVCIIEQGGGSANSTCCNANNWFSISGTGPAGTTGKWRRYYSPSESIEDFGKLIANGTYYYAQGKYKVSEIGSVYCVPPDEWINKVNSQIKTALEKCNNN